MPMSLCALVLENLSFHPRSKLHFILNDIYIYIYIAIDIYTYIYVCVCVCVRGCVCVCVKKKPFFKKKGKLT